MGVERLDEQDYPFASMGQAAELLGVQPAFLRSLDTAGLLHPERSEGGHRRYTRRQLHLAADIRELTGHGHTIASAALILQLREDLDSARQQRRDAEDRQRDAEHQRDVARTDLAAARRALADQQAQAAPEGPADRG
jgi:MerR family transcriptional regulator, heat shock protein HspR